MAAIQTVSTFGPISNKSVKEFCKATRGDARLLASSIRGINKDFYKFVEQTFTLTEEQSADFRRGLDAESAAALAACCVRALKQGRDIDLKCGRASRGGTGERQPRIQVRIEVKVTWRTCSGSGQCCGLCVEWDVSVT